MTTPSDASTFEASMRPRRPHDRAAAPWLNKVPVVTATFWLIKVLSTTIGETFADYLSVNVGLGPAVTDGLVLAALAMALAVAGPAARSVDLLAECGAGQHLRHPGGRLPHRHPGRQPVREHRAVHGRAAGGLRRLASLSTGIAWAYLPHDFPPPSTVYGSSDCG
jgi:hypothetical protein